MADGSGLPSEMSVIEDAERRGRTARWPFWRRAYAQGDPLPALTCHVSRPTYRFDEGEPLPDEYKELLIKMLRHEGERAGDWRESSYVPLAKMSATVERDELGHSEMGYHFLGEIVSDRRGRELARCLLLKWYPAALDMFGRSDSPNVPKFIHWGLKSVGNAEIRQAYKAYVDRKLVALGFEPPDERSSRHFL